MLWSALKVVLLVYLGLVALIYFNQSDLYPLLPIRLLARIRHDTLARLSQVACPVSVIHGRNDDIIPFAHGQRLFEAAHPPKQFLELQGGHNHGFVFGRNGWIQQLDGFLQRTLP